MSFAPGSDGESGTCGDDLTWDLTDGLALIGGSVIASEAVFIYLVVKRFGVIVES